MIREQWLDAEAEEGAFDAVLTLETIERDSFAEGCRNLLPLEPQISSKRDLYLTSIKPRPDTPCNYMPAFYIIKGCVPVAMVEVSETLRIPSPYPLRIYLPARQNLCVHVRDPEGPMVVRCTWARL